MANGSALDRRFDLLKRRAEQESRAGAQQQQDVLKRQFARGGGLGSGAHIKQSALAQERGAKQLAQAREGVEFARLGEMSKREEAEKLRKFQTGEREAGQTFAAQQAQLQRQAAIEEAARGREFTAEQAAIDRGLKVRWERVARRNATAFAEAKLELAKKGIELESTAQAHNIKLSEALARFQGLFDSQPTPSVQPNQTQLSAPAQMDISGLSLGNQQQIKAARSQGRTRLVPGVGEQILSNGRWMNLSQLR